MGESCTFLAFVCFAEFYGKAHGFVIAGAETVELAILDSSWPEFLRSFLFPLWLSFLRSLLLPLESFLGFLFNCFLGFPPRRFLIGTIVVVENLHRHIYRESEWTLANGTRREHPSLSNDDPCRDSSPMVSETPYSFRCLPQDYVAAACDVES